MSRWHTHRRIAQQSFWSISRRLLRSLLTAVGVSLGIAVFLATVGLASTASAQVNATFDELRITRLVVQDTRQLPNEPLFDVSIDEEVEELDGVVAGGALYSVGSGVTVQRNARAGTAPQPMGLVAATPGGLRAAEVDLSGGRLYGEATRASGLPAAVLGPRAADRLGMSEFHPGMAIDVAGVPVTIVGILDSYGSESLLGAAVIVDPATLSTLGMQPTKEKTALVRTRLGAAQSVARALPAAIRPTDPGAVGVVLPPEPESLRADIQGSLNGLALGAAALSLLIGGIGIMNAMLMSVNQRSGEIGLRRALGARPRHIVEQIVIEGALLGVLGGLLGTFVGLGSLIGIAAINSWTPVLAAGLWMVAPLAGLTIGAVAGIYPAMRAAALTPASALRR